MFKYFKFKYTTLEYLRTLRLSKPPGWEAPPKPPGPPPFRN